MEISSKGIEVIKEFEGYREEAYRCSANKLTIGYGHVIKEEDLVNSNWIYFYS